MITSRQFVKYSAMAAGAGLLQPDASEFGDLDAAADSRVVSVGAEDIFAGEICRPEAVHRAFDAGLRELTGEKWFASAWSSMFTRDDVVGIKTNCIAWPKVSSSKTSIDPWARRRGRRSPAAAC